MAFAENGGGASHWASLPPAMLVLPEVLLSRGAGEAWITVCALAGAGADSDAIGETARGRIASLAADATLPPLDPSPTAGVEVTGARPPAHYEEAVAAAVQRIRSGAVSKLVLAREVRVDAPAAHSVPALFGALRELFESCFVFCVGSPEADFIGARRSCSSVATAVGPQRLRSRVPHGAAPTRLSTITSASNCCAVTRTAQSTRSSSAGSSAGSTRTRSGSRSRMSRS